MCTWVTINSLWNLWSKSHLKLYKMDKYGLKKRYDFVPPFSPLRPGTVCISGRYLVPQNEPHRSFDINYVTSWLNIYLWLTILWLIVVATHWVSFTFWPLFLVLSTSMRIYERPTISSKLKIGHLQIHNVVKEVILWIPIPRQKVRNWKQRSRK